MNTLRIFLLGFLFIPLLLTGQETFKYHSPSEVDALLQEVHRQNPETTVLHRLTETPGNRPVQLMQIGKGEGKPAILLIANLEGNRLLGTEGALWMINDLLSKPEEFQNRVWYILPLANPDAASTWFSGLRYERHQNQLPINNDLDEAVNEDGPDDLNGDGMITMMRKKDPGGTLIPVEGNDMLMRRAKTMEGEKGIYKTYPEGLDNDGDGTINEDDDGGVELSIAFPHLFDFYAPETGKYAGYTPEVFHIMKFAAEHQQIAMMLYLGSTNFCLQAPKGGRKGSADFSSIQVPENVAEMFGADPNKTYSMEEIMTMVQPMLPPGMEVEEGMIASFLGLGAVVNPMQEDLAFYNDMNDKYKEYLKDKGAEEDRYPPEAAKDGSAELWSYYHMGRPVFSMDLWGLPKLKEEKKEEGSGITVEQLQEMSKEEFLALGEEKIDAFLKEMGAPQQYNAKMVMGAVEAGQMGTKQMAAMMKQMPAPEKKSEDGADPREKAMLAFAEEHGIEAFVQWTPFNHPTLGEVEIGGFIPNLTVNPPAPVAREVIETKIPWFYELSHKLPALSLEKVTSKAKSGEVHELTVWVRNESYLPFPTAMGTRNKYPPAAHIILEADGIEFLSGYKRTNVFNLKGMKSKKFTWLVKAPEGTEIQVQLSGYTIEDSVQTIKIGQ